MIPARLFYELFVRFFSRYFAVALTLTFNTVIITSNADEIR